MLRLGVSGQSDSIQVNGTCDLGGTLTLTAASGFQLDPSAQWSLISSTETISGTFTNLNRRGGKRLRCLQ
jgi:hypothetical protein